MLPLLVPGVGMGGGRTTPAPPILFLDLVMECQPVVELVCEFANILNLVTEP